MASTNGFGSGSVTPVSDVDVLAHPLSDKSSASGWPRRSASASSLVESIAVRSSLSSAVYVYDLAEHVAFGALSKSWAGSNPDTAPVIALQTRDGAGLSLLGRLSQSTSKDGGSNDKSVITAYITPPGLAAMVHSLSALPAPAPSSRLVLQVPAVTPSTGALGLSPTLAALSTAVPLLPETFAVLLSATPQETVELAALAYQITDSHVIHVFDHHSSARELGHLVTPPSPEPSASPVSVKAALDEAGYSFFDYAGDNEAHSVVVMLNGPLALAAKALAKHVPGFGVVTVRVLRPWDESALKSVLPSSVKQVHVVEEVPTQTTDGTLYVDVFSTLVDPTGSGPIVNVHRLVPVDTQRFIAHPTEFTDFVLKLAPAETVTPSSLSAPSTKRMLFFSAPGTSLSAASHFAQSTFTSHSTIRARFLRDHDAYSRSGGLIADRLILTPKSDVEEHVPAPLLLPLASEQDGVADFVSVADLGLLKTHSILSRAKPGSPVLLIGSWDAAELIASLPPQELALAHDRSLHVCILDAKAIVEGLKPSDTSVVDALQNVAVHLAFLRLYLGKLASEPSVCKIASATYGERVGGVRLADINSRVWNALVEVELPAAPPAVEDAKPIVLKDFEFSAVAIETDDGDTVVNGARLGSWRDIAKHLLFHSSYTPDALVSPSLTSYDDHPALRPELPERTFLVTCTVNRRLTPLEYDRNVFHLEFDTSGTGLKYEIGEALGVHGWNDAAEVLDFCRWYGADPGRSVTLPVPGADDGRVHTRTVFQALQQQIDLFGKPPKSFYTDLAPHAAREVDRHALLFIGSPDGGSTFKKMSEKETVTFADVLQRFPSARPSIEKLCEMVGDIKPRHYSIASAQAVVGDRVDLLVVTVDWLTPSGSPRYGQCTRYLAGLKVGQKVTVSIKPSVMKLPPDNTQPLILAGLGTGAAPFRAFLQHRAWLASQSVPVGPVYYYFGSRHQSQEYLYGEEIEAYMLDNTITRAGLAFSRDGPRKIYIQHKMKEDAEALAKMLRAQNGVFYLCGPTWPVGDVYDALVDALGRYEGMEKEAAGEYLEGLKDEERYVLEVY